MASVNLATGREISNFEAVSKVGCSVSEVSKKENTVLRICWAGMSNSWAPCATVPAVQVVEFKKAEELQSLIDLSLQDEGVDEEQLLQLCRKALHYSVHTGELLAWSGQHYLWQPWILQPTVSSN